MNKGNQTIAIVNKYEVKNICKQTIEILGKRIYDYKMRTIRKGWFWFLKEPKNPDLYIMRRVKQIMIICNLSCTNYIYLTTEDADVVYGKELSDNKGHKSFARVNKYEIKNLCKQAIDILEKKIHDYKVDCFWFCKQPKEPIFEKLRKVQQILKMCDLAPGNFIFLTCDDAGLLAEFNILEESAFI